MKSWSSPHVPVLPGRGRPVALHDTASGQLRVTRPGPVAGMYVCGITPYDATHMGHAATYLAFDLLHRAWRDAGHEVRYVQNVTDVDDPLLERASATGEDWRDLARRETELFATDMAALAVLPPDVFLGAVETIPLAAAAVSRIVDEGAGYRHEASGDVYFDVRADPRFGEVGHYDDATMLDLFGRRGGDPQTPGKRTPLDPVLWRAERPGEPSWDGGALGRGRPGWHIECVAIALDHLGSGFDVQGGGSDLVFPHHEMGASHAHALTGKPYAQTYTHAGMVGLDGEKMSKSLGNLVLVSRLRELGEDPMAVRLAVLAHHYRGDWSWTDSGLARAREQLTRWRAAVQVPTPAATAAGLLAALRERLADDLDAPGALGAVDTWAGDQLAAGEQGTEPDRDAGSSALVADAVDALLGVRLATT